MTTTRRCSPFFTLTELMKVITVALLCVIFFASCTVAFKTINPKIEAQCIEKGGQVLATPGKFSSCLYSAK